MIEKYNFQYCQKIVVLSKDRNRVLLCKRKDEADFDGVFSFIGGKMETTDSSIVEGLKREKDEEAGEEFKLKLHPTFSLNLLYKKKDGASMILPHYLAIYEDGEVFLSEEYSEYRWVKLEDLETFEPKIANIPSTIASLLRLGEILEERESFII